MKVAGTVGDVLVGSKRTGSHISKSATPGSRTFRPSTSSTGVLPLSWKYFGESSEPAVGKRQMTNSDLDSRLEEFGPVAWQVHLLLDCP